MTFTLYKITARAWNDSFRDRFGQSDNLHGLSDSEVIEAIIQFGRASIVLHQGHGAYRILEFQNDYD